jgi:ATP-binding cassette subfamily B protein
MMRKDLSRKVSRIPVGSLDKMRKGDILSRFVNDIDTMRLRSVESITRTGESLIMLIGCVVIMTFIDWRLMLAAMLPMLIGFVGMRVVVRFSHKYYRAQSRNLGKMNTIVEETYRGLNVITLYNGLDDVKAKFMGVNKDLYSVSFRSRMMGELMPSISGLVNNMGYVSVCIVASLLILDGSATFGTLVAFIAYVKICNRPIMSLSNTVGGLQEVAAAAERIFEFLDTPEMEDESGKGVIDGPIEGKVRFNDVCFSYNPGTEVIHDLNLDVAPGMRIAIVGPTGAGKTTISNLLLRYYDPDSGSITLDGVKLTDLRREEVRKQFGVVLQDVWLFKGTIRQNLVFGSEDVPEERIMEACRAVGLEHFINAHPEGLDTYINNPDSLSSGQKQQISIARAIIKDAPMLIMDEATSSVDTRTEAVIQDAMDQLMKGRTSFVIAHRLSTIKNADHIIVIRKGEIIERGTHEELLSKGGFYRSLYDSQFEFCD